MSKILIVDDEKNICDLLNLYLVKEGYETTCAYDGEQAIEMFSHQKFDVVILDIMLPKKDGWDVCREIRKTSNVPIIMLSAKGEVFDKVLGLKIGADDYMVKPFDSNELVARVQDMDQSGEVILALSGDVEGETTSFYIYRQVAQYGIKVSSLARGLGFGDDLEYADELTLGRSIVNRQIFKP